MKTTTSSCLGFVCPALLWCACVSTPTPPVALTQVDLGLTYLAQGQCDQAYARLTHALEFDPDLAHAHNGLGLIAMQCDGDLLRAAQHFKDALAIDVDFVAARTNLGVTFLERTPPELDAACELFESALEIAPSAIEPRENLVRCKLRQAITGDDDALETAYRHAMIFVEIAPNVAAAHELLGAIRLRREEPALAARRLAHCIDIDPRRARCHYYLAHAHLAREQCADAMASFVAALTNGDTIEVEVRRDLAAASFRCALADEAMRRALDTIAKAPSDPQSHVSLARIFEDKGWYAQAEHSWQTVLQLAPDWCPAHFALFRAADRRLDTRGVIEHCGAYARCGEREADAEQVCNERVRGLTTEPNRFTSR
ncbi:MAG: tetratricopeptide repeat protein [Deltaproteobacteria bacterium]|jgi:Tfp pilus assembly protein PilF